MKAGIIADKLGCERGGRMLFAGVGFTLGAGDALIVTGRNGVGKSSLLRMIGGLLAPLGQLDVHGRCALADGRSALDAEISLVAALRFWSMVGEAALLDAINQMGLSALNDAPVRALSQGQRQRAALVRLRVSEAPIWLLDEPTNALDDAGVVALRSIIAGHRRAGGILVIAAHGPPLVEDAQSLSLEGFVC